MNTRRPCKPVQRYHHVLVLVCKRKRKRQVLRRTNHAMLGVRTKKNRFLLLYFDKSYNDVYCFLYVLLENSHQHCYYRK